MQLTMPPITRPREVDFGPPIRKATCYLYNLPEVVSTFECLRVPTVSARFSTAPFFWNWAMIAVARLAPQGFLEDRAKYGRAPTATHVCAQPHGRPHACVASHPGEACAPAAEERLPGSSEHLWSSWRQEQPCAWCPDTEVRGLQVKVARQVVGSLGAPG